MAHKEARKSTDKKTVATLKASVKVAEICLSAPPSRHPASIEARKGVLMPLPRT